MTQDIDGIIKLKPAASSGITNYYGASPTTCTVGGLTGNTVIYGVSMQDILEDILVPTLNPILTNPTSSFCISPTTLCYEVGDVINVTGCTCFDYGCICQYWTGGTSSNRSGYALCYEYSEWGGTVCCASGYLPTQSVAFTGHTVTAGNNTLSSKVWYSGGTQPYNSAGNPYLSGLTSGSTTATVKVINGLYPYFYGTYASLSGASGANRPTTGLTTIITGGTKVVAISNNTICINYSGATTNDYIWFAIPEACTPKTKWYVNAINCGTIGGGVSPGCNLFPSPSTVTGVTTTCWSGQSYQLYISNYQTTVNAVMELRNS